MPLHVDASRFERFERCTAWPLAPAKGRFVRLARFDLVLILVSPPFRVPEIFQSPAAKRGVAALLHGATLASVSNEAANLRNSRPETAHWHYVSISIRWHPSRGARECQSEA
jgi:hypothetical protein